MTTRLIELVEDAVAQMSLEQSTYLLAKLGGWDQEFFTISGTTCQFSLRSLLKSKESVHSLNNIPIYFEGGPDGNTRYIGYVSTFIADRILQAIGLFGQLSVFDDIAAAFALLHSEDNKSLEWDELDALERYSG